MFPGRFLFFALVLALCSAAGGLGAAEPNSAEGTVRKTKGGLQFQVPADWPIEERNGMVGPIPIEEYLGRKFKAIDAQLQGIEQRLSSVDLRLRVLEEQAKQAAKPLQSSEQASR